MISISELYKIINKELGRIIKKIKIKVLELLIKEFNDFPREGDTVTINGTHIATFKKISK